MYLARLHSTNYTNLYATNHDICRDVFHALWCNVLWLIYNLMQTIYIYMIINEVWCVMIYHKSSGSWYHTIAQNTELMIPFNAYFHCFLYHFRSYWPDIARVLTDISSTCTLFTRKQFVHVSVTVCSPNHCLYMSISFLCWKKTTPDITKQM